MNSLPEDERTVIINTTSTATIATADDTDATQIGGSVVCAVCQAPNSTLDRYCVDCGFLLSSSVIEPMPEEEKGEANPYLVEQATGRRFELQRGVISIGRERCDILLMDKTISRRHCQITIQEDGAVLFEDLNSTNGLTVDGVRIAPEQPVTLHHGASIRLGSSGVLTLELPGQSSEATIQSVAMEKTEVAESEAETPMEGAPEASEEEQIVVAWLRPTVGNAPDVKITEGTVTIGRRASNKVVLATDPFVSGRHIELKTDNIGTTITDVGSTNGTLVNENKIEPNTPQLLLDGDTVTIGQTTYRYETAEIPINMGDEAEVEPKQAESTEEESDSKNESEIE